MYGQHLSCVNQIFNKADIFATQDAGVAGESFGVKTKNQKRN